MILVRDTEYRCMEPTIYFIAGRGYSGNKWKHGVQWIQQNDEIELDQQLVCPTIYGYVMWT